MPAQHLWSIRVCEDYMSTIAFDQFALTRIADFARSLSRLHLASRRRLVDDDAIDREFNAVCMSVWGYTTDDFSDELFSVQDHAFLDALDEAQARIFAAHPGYSVVLIALPPASPASAQPPSVSRRSAIRRRGPSREAARWPRPSRH